MPARRSSLLHTLFPYVRNLSLDAAADRRQTVRPAHTFIFEDAAVDNDACACPMCRPHEQAIRLAVPARGFASEPLSHRFTCVGDAASSRIPGVPFDRLTFKRQAN